MPGLSPAAEIPVNRVPYGLQINRVPSGGWTQTLTQTQDIIRHIKRAYVSAWGFNPRSTTYQVLIELERIML